MRTKLTLRLDEELIARAKAWARANGVSLSQAVAGFFAQLSDESERDLSPWTRRLLGAARRSKDSPAAEDERIQKDYLDYLEAKHR